MSGITSSKVSVIIPMYNSKDSILDCLKPLLKQDYENYEILIVDDGSTDGSYELCCEEARKNKCIKVIHQENQGSGAARNTGIKHASGEYAYFPDADDFVEANAFSVLVKEMEDTGADLIVFGFRGISKSKKVSTHAFKRKCFDGEYVRNNYNEFGYSDFEIMGAPWNKFFRMDIIREHRLEYPILRRHQDEVFIMRYVSHVRSVQFIEDVLFNHYENSLELRYKKYPFDYFHTATGLKNFRMSIAFQWNPSNEAMKAYFSREYYVNTLRSMELLFNPKWSLTDQKRRTIIEETIDTFNLEVPTQDFNRVVYPFNDKFHKAFREKDSRYICEYIPRELKTIAMKERIKKILHK